MATELVLDSLRRRLRALHSLYDDALATMDIEQVNHFERPGVLPIAFSLFHIVNMIDAAFMVMTGRPPLWDDDWCRRVQPAIPDHGKERTVAEMVDQRIGDYAAFGEYLQAVFICTEEWLDGVTVEELSRVVVPRPLPPQLASTYSARVAGPEGVTLLDAVECWVYQHALRHTWERSSWLWVSSAWAG